MLSVTPTPVELIDDDTATRYYNEFDTLEGAERESRAEALRLWADQKDADQKREQFDTLNKIYSDFDGYVNDAGLQDFDEDSRYNIANRQFIASQFDQTPEEQQDIYSSFRDKWTESVVGKKGMSEKETFDLIKQGMDARNEVSEAANQIPGDIALSLFDSIGGGDPVDVPKLVETWKTKNADSIKKLPPGWEAPLLESAQAFHTETEGMLRDYAEPLKKVYDHLAAVTGRDTERAGETNPKNQEEMDSMVDTLASMPKPVRERAYASVVLGAQKAGQDPKKFMEQWGESWSRTLNMVRTGALTAQEMAAESDLRMLEDKTSPPDYYISKSTGEKIPLANRAFYDEADLRKVTPEEIAAEADQARQKVKRFEVVRELQSVADNQFDPIEKINKGGFLGFMEAMAYGSPQGLAYTATALVPVVGPYIAGAAMFSDEYNQLRQQGMSVDQAVQIGSVSAAVQAGLERTGAKAIFGKLPAFEKLMRKIGNPARVGKAGSAGVRFLAAATGEQFVEGAQDLTTPLVQDVSEALGADVPDVKWQPILEKWGGSRLDVLAASLPTILLGTGVSTFADNKRFAQFEERQDRYRMTGMDDATIKKIEDGKDLAEVQQNFQSEFGKLTPENVKAGVAYMEGKIASAKDQQEDPNTHTLTRETLADGSKKFVIRDPKGDVKYTTSDEQTAQIALSELLRTQITGTTRGIFESISFFNQMNEAAGRGEDVQKFLLSNAPRTLLTDYEANPTEQNLNNLFETVRSQGQDINEPAELANFPVLASNQGALVEGVFRSIIQIQDGATGDKVVRDFSQDNLKRAISEGRITMDWVRENLNQIIPLIESERNTGPALRTETDTDVIESFSDVALAYMTGRIRENQIPEGFRGFLRRMAIIVKDIYRRAYNLKRLVAEGKVDANFETLLADSVGLNQQARVDTASNRVSKDIITDGGQMLMDFSIGSRTNAVSTDTPSIRASNATITGPANYSIAAHHGTPHKVDKFSTAKIGTGEGAQAYGWGLYFAENRDVAETYQKGMAPEFETPSGRVKFPEMDFSDDALAADYLNRHNGDFAKAMADQEAFAAKNSDNPIAVRFSAKVRSLLEKWKEDGWKWVKPESNLYTVELDVEPEDLLDWDKPLSEQSEKVMNAVRKSPLWPSMVKSAGVESGFYMESLLKGIKGEAFYNLMGGQSPYRPVTSSLKEASEKLLKLGIPGIRYLDGGSRSDGEGTYNYVVFDENLIKITEENGNRIPASQALAGPATGATNYSIGQKQDADYLAAVESGDMETVQKMVDEAAKSAGYLPHGDFRDSHTAPSGPAGADEEVRNGDADASLVQVARGVHIQPDDYFDPRVGPQYYSYKDKAGMEAFKAIRAAMDKIQQGKKAFVTVFRAVPNDIKGAKLENRDWVTPSKTYAVNHGESRFGEGEYRIINESVPAETLFWDGNDIREWGKDDGKDYAYKNTKNNRKLIDPVTYDDAGNVIPLSQRFNPRSPSINYSIGIARNAISQVSEKDDASRVGTAKLGTAKVPKNTPQDSNVSGDNVPDDLLAKQMEKMNYAHLPKNILSEKDPKKKRRKLINWFKKNLLALHDAFPEEFRARATHWYDGANRIAKEMGSQFQASVEQASGVIAVFSPQKDWFMNVAQAEQFMELWTNSQDVVLEESLVRAEIEGIIEAATVADKQKRKKVDGETKEQTAERREYNKALDKLEKEKRRKIVEQVIGKTIRQLDATPTLQGWGIRVLAQVTFGRNYRNLSPEGDRLGMATNDDGALSKNGWGSTNEIEKAVRIMKDGSLKNISDNLGNEHKVRNFYNNIVAPNTPYGDATIDTHAVAAAHLMPYGAKATEVGHNFGSGMNGSEVLGISGVYHLYLDAYREAAADRGILPRQMQSITWEAIRLVYPAATKNAATLAKSQKTWKDLTDDSARNTLVGGRIPSPVWAGVNDNRESQALSSGLQEDGSGDVSGGGLLSGVRPTGAGRDGGVNYSIASQSEIDRVNRALGGMNRGPDERLKVYQRAKQKFSKVMAWNSDELAAMADTGSDDSQIRRTQILQGLGELDGIMSVLPPEVRGRVGGYTKLAGIAPHDVFKDGVKISEVSGMKGALISAWMDQGLNIGQAGKKVDFPPGYTATENLSTKRADKAIADFFRDRIKKIDTELEKVLVREYTEAITKAVKQSRPKAGDNGVRKSTLGAETQKFADMVQRATLLDDEATPKRMAEIEAALANPDATAEDISALSEEWSILNTFGDLDNRSSETLAQGLDWLKGQLQMGREAWRIKEQARIDEQRSRAAATIEWLGKGTAKKRFADKGLMQRIAEVGNNYLLDHASFEQFVTAMLPPEIAANFSERLRKADMAAQSSEIRDGKGILDAVREGAKAANMSAGDAMLWLKGDQKNAVAYLEGRKVKDERIAIDLAQKIVTGMADRSKLTDADVETLRNELAALPADTQKEFVTIKRVIFRGEDVKLDMSRAKAIQLLLSWNQPDVQIKMRKEGWTDESAADLKALVNDPVSRSVVSYLQSLYGKGAGIVNPVYSRMFGMTMPQVKNYAPTRFLNAKDSKDIGLDGSPTATGTTPGFAKSRVTHSAKIAPEDALTVAQGHIAQQAHWVHFAELAREFRALLSSPDVRESLKQAHGDGVLKSAELWADQLEQRGGNKAKEIAWLNPILGTVLSGKAVSSLGFSLKTLAMQLDNTIRFGLALDMRQIVSALSNPATITEDIQTVWESNAIQNRLQGGATAEARFLFSRYAGKPNFAAKIAEASMTPINWLDSAATSISSAIVYRANLNDAIAAGMPENLAKQTALDAASQAIYRFAQPVSFGQKSIVENNGNVMAKMFFLFMSDARLKTAILADAARGLATGSGDKGTHIRRILAIETMAVLSHVVSSAFRDAFSDDDDDEIWNPGGFAKAMLLAPLQGFFFAGTGGELAISKLTGQKTFNSTTQNPLLSSMEEGVRALNNLEDAFDLDDPDAMLKEWNNIFRSMALSPSMAAPAVLLNMIKPVVGLYQNATSEE